MKFIESSLPFLTWPLNPFSESVTRSDKDPLLENHLGKARFSVRLLRYWWAAQAIRREAAGREGPLTILDYGAGRGWLKRFVGEDIDAKWIALDWQPQTKLLVAAGYDEIRQCNFDHTLPVDADSVDIVSSLHVFEHLPRAAFSLIQIQQILAPGGCLLAGTPTMPDLFARWRQTSFRKRLAKGEIARGGHINSFSPGRWKSLLGDCGLESEFIVGSHLIRHTGNPLENSKLWIRLNQLWGSIFPSLGSEVCLLARKPVIEEEGVANWQPQALGGGQRFPRIAIASASVAAVLAILIGILVITEEPVVANVENVLEKQLQIGAEHLLMIDHPRLLAYKGHRNATVIHSISEIPQALSNLPDDTHIVLHENHLEAMGADVNRYVIDSRIDVEDDDFYLIRKGTQGTCLEHFLSR